MEEGIMQWYRASISLKADPKTARLQKALGVSLVESIGYIHLLYSFSAQFAENGDLKKYQPEEIEAACLWQGADKRLFSAFLSVGFVDEKSEGLYKVHGFYEANTRHLKDIARKRRARTVHGQGADSPRTGRATNEPTNETNKTYTDYFYSVYFTKFGQNPRPPQSAFINLAKLVKSGIDLDHFKQRVITYFDAAWPESKDLQGLLTHWDKFAKPIQAPKPDRPQLRV